MEGRKASHQPDYVLYFTIVLLVAVGIVTVFSASTVVALQAGLSATHFAIRQLGAAVVGLILMTAFMYVPYRAWYRYAALAVAACIPLLMLVLAVGKSANGGKRWIGTSSLHLQPSELAIVAVVLYLAFFFSKKATLVHDFKRGIVPPLLVIGVLFLLIFVEPDMGTALTLLATAVAILFMSGIRWRTLFTLALSTLPVLLMLALSAKYRSGRLTAFLDPFKHSQGTAYQLLQGWTAISAGGWFGRGFDMSMAKTGYLYAPQTDFIFPVFVEEWGLVGGAALLITFGVLIWRGFMVGRHAPDRFGALVATGLTSMVAAMSLINLGAVSGLLPVTGIPLPFISYGGTALVVNMASLGILLSVSRYTLDEEPEADTLADVIDVAYVRERKQESEEDLFRKPDRPSARPARQRTAQVHSLGGRRSGQKSGVGGWRARQESAPTRRPDVRTSSNGRSSSRKEVDRRSRASSKGMSWRERNEMLNTKQRSDRSTSSNKSGKKKPGSLFGKRDR